MKNNITAEEVQKLMDELLNMVPEKPKRRTMPPDPDEDFIKELTELDDELMGRMTSDRRNRPNPPGFVPASGTCTCTSTDKCPLGRVGTATRCTANQLRDGLLVMQKALAYMRVSHE